ncbi:tetratricopeptide repeat protein [Coleofasciculus sp. G2-EDA-02]|uniref:tetratricopeptide repeat protein n=1 Tax=Coleofasciculus sp. G2-EDA-02 TaxID=3069529 RepID=UPI0032F96716
MKVSRFTPSLMQHEDLEAIFVQRHQLAEDIVKRISDSVLTPSPHHTLLIGSRGIGKTHLVSLVYHRIRQQEALQNRLLIAWLREEEWGVTSFLDLLLRIFRALQENDGDFAKIQVKGGREGLIKRVESLYELSPDEAEHAGAELLKEIIGENSLLLLMENLDDIFSGLGKKGQKQLHAFLQENPCCTILATSQSLFDEVKKEKSLFYGFFDIDHLEDLTVEEAIQLLANIARVRGDRELESFIRQSRGRDRIQAVHHLAGGNHRVYVIFSEFLTRQSLDELVEPFMRMLDDLTPYYQARMASLSPQQRKIVEFLCDRRHGVPVKEIAQRCFLTHQTASSQLKDLREKGYVISDAIGRESFYEMREPLMRFCLEVKKQRGEPIQLFVDFLRIWYTKEELLQRLLLLNKSSKLEREYIVDALQDTYDEYAYIIENFNAFINNCTQEKLIALIGVLLKSFSSKETNKNELIDVLETLGFAFYYIGRYEEAIIALNEAIEINPNNTNIWDTRGMAMIQINRQKEALVSFNKIIDIDPNNVKAWHLKGVFLDGLGQYEEGLNAYERALEITPNDVEIWLSKGWTLIKLERTEEALASFNKIIELDPNHAEGWLSRGIVKFGFKCYEEALASYNKVAEINPHSKGLWFCYGELLYEIKHYEQALICYEKAIKFEPNKELIWFGYGIVQVQLKQYKKALDSFDEAIKLNSKNTIFWYNRGCLLGKLERYQEALESFNTAIALGDQYSDVFFNRAECILALNRWDEGIEALNDTLNRFAHADESDLGDTEAIIRNLFNSTTDSAIWRSRIKTLIELYHKHQVISTLGQGFVKSVPTLMSEMVSDKAAQTWLEVWQELASDYPEFQIPLRLLDTAVRYKQTKGNKRVLFSLPIEERKLLEPLLGIE